MPLSSRCWFQVGMRGHAHGKMVTLPGLIAMAASLPLPVGWPDGQPHPVLDARDTLNWPSPKPAIGARDKVSMSDGAAGIAVEVRTDSGSWRTVGYPRAA